MAVRRVVDCVVAGAHDRPNFPMYAVMYVCSPNSLAEQEKYMGEEMGWHEEERYHMRNCLQYPVQWMEGQPWQKKCKKQKRVHLNIDADERFLIST